MTKFIKCNFKNFVIISIIFLLSRLIIFSTISLNNELNFSANKQYFRYISGEAKIFLPYQFNRIELVANSEKNKDVKILINSTYLETISLNNERSTYIVDIPPAVKKSGENTIKFTCNDSYIPHLVDSSKTDKRNLSWTMHSLKTDVNPHDDLVSLNTNINKTLGIHAIEKKNTNASLSIIKNGLHQGDALCYTDIIDNGYTFNGNYYMPQNVNWPFIFPLLGYLLKEIFSITALESTLFINNLSVFISLFIIFYLSKKVLNDNFSSYFPIIFLSFYPYGMFLASGFSEGLFILFEAISILFLIKKRPALFCLFAGALGGIRTVGIMSPIILIYAWFFIYKNKFTLKSVSKLSLYTIVSTWGMLSYITYCWLKFDSPLLVFKIQNAFGHNGFIPTATIQYYLLEFPISILSGNLFDPIHLGALLSLTLLIFSVVYLIRFYKTLSLLEHVLIVFSLVMLLVPFAGFYMDAIGRYSLLSFPAFIILTKFLNNDKYRSILLILIPFLTFGLVWMTMRFCNGLTPM